LHENNHLQRDSQTPRIGQNTIAVIWELNGRNKPAILAEDYEKDLTIVMPCPIRASPFLHTKHYMLFPQAWYNSHNRGDQPGDTFTLIKRVAETISKHNLSNCKEKADCLTLK
jgi:hypothetical protein